MAALSEPLHRDLSKAVNYLVDTGQMSERGILQSISNNVAETTES